MHNLWVAKGPRRKAEDFMPIPRRKARMSASQIMAKFDALRERMTAAQRQRGG